MQKPLVRRSVRFFFAPLVASFFAAAALVATPLTAPVVSPSPGAALSPPRADFDPCDVNGVERIVAVADIHGAYDQFIAIMKAAELIDDKGHWIGGRTHFVQTGDVIDRGPASRKVLDLLRRLEDEAEKAGGRVYPLLGNHEVAVMLGDLRSTSPEEYEEFRTPDSEELREQFIKMALQESGRKARDNGSPFDEKKVREKLLKEVPPGWVERRLAFGPNGTYGKWLRKHDTVARINRILFVHAGLSQAIGSKTCKEINETVRDELTKKFDRTVAAPLESLAASPQGPLWYRIPVQEENLFMPFLDAILARFKARAMVGGHSVIAGGHIVPHFRGKLFLIDTGMLSSVYPGGRPSALEIEGDVATAIYVGGRERLEPGPPADGGGPQAPGREPKD